MNNENEKSIIEVSSKRPSFQKPELKRPELKKHGKLKNSASQVTYYYYYTVYYYI